MVAADTEGLVAMDMDTLVAVAVQSETIWERQVRHLSGVCHRAICKMLAHRARRVQRSAIRTTRRELHETS